MATITFTEKQLASLHRLVEYLVVDSEEIKDFYNQDKDFREDHIYNNIKDVSEVLDLDWTAYEELYGDDEDCGCDDDKNKFCDEHLCKGCENHIDGCECGIWFKECVECDTLMGGKRFTDEEEFDNHPDRMEGYDDKGNWHCEKCRADEESDNDE